MVKHEDKPVPTGDAAWRVLIPRERILHDPQAMKLLNSNVGMRWMGPKGHTMAYPVSIDL